MLDALRRRGPVRSGAVVLAAGVVLAALAGPGCSGSDDRAALPSPSGTAAPAGPSSPGPGTASGPGSGSVTAAGPGTTPAGDRPATTDRAVASSTTGTAAAAAAAVPALPGSCPPAGPVPAGVGNRSSVRADLDGDGTPDEVEAFAVRTPAGAGDWRIRVTFAAGGGTDLTLAEDPAPGVVRVLGSARLDGPENAAGPATLFAWTGSGASARIVGLFRVAGCALVPVASAAGQPAAFLVGASVGHQEGVRCEVVAGRRSLVEVLSEPVGRSYRVTRLTLVVDGATLVPTGAAAVSDEAQPPAEAGRIVGCGDVPVTG
jgi:hypothetical protein